MIKLTANPSEKYLDKALEALDVLANENGPGNDFLGWKKLPTETPESLFEECDEVVANWKNLGVEVVVAIGIGGSYLGAKATIEALSHNFEAYMPAKGPRVVFAGHNLSEDYHAELLEYLEGKSVQRWLFQNRVPLPNLLLHSESSNHILRQNTEKRVHARESWL